MFVSLSVCVCAHVKCKYISFLGCPNELKLRAKDTTMQKEQGDRHSGWRWWVLMTQPKPTITRGSSDNFIFGARLCTESSNTKKHTSNTGHPPASGKEASYLQLMIKVLLYSSSTETLLFSDLQKGSNPRPAFLFNGCSLHLGPV